MSILNELDKLEDRQASIEERQKAAEEMVDRVLKASADLRAQSEALGEQMLEISKALANVPAAKTDRGWDVFLAQGQDGRQLRISERDCLPLLMAVVGVLGRKPPRIVLASGDLVELDMGDVEQIAAQILEHESGETPQAAGA